MTQMANDEWHGSLGITCQGRGSGSWLSSLFLHIPAFGLGCPKWLFHPHVWQRAGTVAEPGLARHPAFSMQPFHTANLGFLTAWRSQRSPPLHVAAGFLPNEPCKGQDAEADNLQSPGLEAGTVSLHYWWGLTSRCPLSLLLWCGWGYRFFPVILAAEDGCFPNVLFLARLLLSLARETRLLLELFVSALVTFLGCWLLPHSVWGVCSITKIQLILCSHQPMCLLLGTFQSLLMLVLHITSRVFSCIRGRGRKRYVYFTFPGAAVLTYLYF